MKTLTADDLSKFSAAELKYYVDCGMLRVMETKPIPPRPARIEDTQEFIKHKKLLGKPIHLSEASRKYKIGLGTISRWASRGLIKKLDPEKNKVVLDEAYVAYAVDIWQTHQATRGKWLFDTNGTPYIPSTTRKR